MDKFYIVKHIFVRNQPMNCGEGAWEDRYFDTYEEAEAFAESQEVYLSSDEVFIIHKKEGEE